MLTVRTARISYTQPDRLNVTRKSATPEGIIFAPSWDILGPALTARKSGRLDEHWPQYVASYTAEMRRSYREHRARWDALLDRERVCLLCYCVDAAQCHRTVLAGILVKLGAAYEGEFA